MYLAYIESQGITDEYLLKAAEHIDMLTFNRITEYNLLTDYQKNVIDRAYNRLTVFERDNSDLIDSYLKSYSINGVSMSFGDSWNLKIINGIAVPSDIYRLLLSTGLCYPVI